MQAGVSARATRATSPLELVMADKLAGHRVSVKRLRCVIIVYHRMFRDLITTMLHAAPGLAIDVVGSAGTVADGIATCDRSKPDVVLLAVGLPDGTGATVAEHLASARPEARVVVISGQSSTFEWPATIQRSAHAVIRKADSFDALQAILASLSASRTGTATPTARRARHPSLDQCVRLLSPREREILALIGASLTCQEIANKIDISIHTVHTHRKHIVSKLGVSGRKLVVVACRFRDQIAACPGG
jgi:DNA-binding NarL/FixJ family response regulator